MTEMFKKSFGLIFAEDRTFSSGKGAKELLTESHFLLATRSVGTHFLFYNIEPPKRAVKYSVDDKIKCFEYLSISSRTRGNRVQVAIAPHWQRAQSPRPIINQVPCKHPQIL